MRSRPVLATWLLLGSLRVTHAQIIFPGSSGVNQGQSSDDSRLESALQTAVSADRLDRSSEAFYAAVFNHLTPRCTVPTGGIYIGFCGRLSQCPYLVPYVRRLGESEYFKFVKRHICSIQGTFIYLCCPSQAPQFQQPLQSPKTSNASPQSSQVQPPQNGGFNSQSSQVQPPQNGGFNSQSSQVQPPQNGGFNSQLGFSRPTSSTGGVAPSSTKSGGNTFGGSPDSIASICGLSNEIRVVGGQPIEPGSWPWLAAIGFPGSEGRFLVVCGGSLITTRHVLTAAHCFADQELTHVRLGEHDTESNNDGAQPIDFRIVRHVNPGYNKITKMNDLELLTLDRAVVFSDYIRPACLPTRSLALNHFENAQFGIVGWGATAEGYRGSNVPQAARIFNVEINKCAAQYASLIRIDNLTMMCAARSGTDACQGDSGGPLHYLSVEAGRYYLVGVVSFGKGCARQDFPGVYTRVDAFLQWINQAIINF